MTRFQDTLRHVKLPAWARRDHPLVARELAQLPAFLGTRGRLRDKVLAMAIGGMGIAPCLCGCGVLGPVLMLAGLLPAVWSAPVISREVKSGRWYDLRTLPYSTREIVLAKLSAVAYRMLPLLAFLLAAQVVSALLSGLFAVAMFGSTMLFYSSSSGTQQLDALFGGLSGQPITQLVFLGLAAVVTPITTALDFMTNLALGALTGTLTTSRGLAVFGALGMRFLLSLGLLGLTLAGLALLTGDFALSAILAVMSGITGSVFWASTLTPDHLLGGLLVIGGLLAIQVGMLAGSVALTIWKTERL